MKHLHLFGKEKKKMSNLDAAFSALLIMKKGLLLIK